MAVSDQTVIATPVWIVTGKMLDMLYIVAHNNAAHVCLGETLCHQCQHNRCDAISMRVFRASGLSNLHYELKTYKEYGESGGDDHIRSRSETLPIIWAFRAHKQ